MYVCLPVTSHPSHPSNNRAEGLSSLHHIANSHWLSILHMVMYMFQCYSLNLSHKQNFIKSTLHMCQGGSKTCMRWSSFFTHPSSWKPVLCSFCAQGPYPSITPPTSLHPLSLPMACLSYTWTENLWLNLLPLELVFLTWGLWTPKIIMQDSVFGDLCPLFCRKNPPLSFDSQNIPGSPSVWNHW